MSVCRAWLGVVQGRPRLSAWPVIGASPNCKRRKSRWVRLQPDAFRPNAQARLRWSRIAGRRLWRRGRRDCADSYNAAVASRGPAGVRPPPDFLAMHSAVVFWLVAALIVLVRSACCLRALLARRAVDAAPAPTRSDRGLPGPEAPARRGLRHRVHQRRRARAPRATILRGGLPTRSRRSPATRARDRRRRIRRRRHGARPWCCPPPAAGIYLALGQPASFVAPPPAR